MKTWGFDITSSVPNRFDEPDMREEFRKIMRGTVGEPPRGHWIVLRRSDLANRSEYWNPETKESIGGPPFEYKDYLIRARYRTFTTGQQEYRDIMGLIETPVKIYYIDYRYRPKKEDYILEIANCAAGSAPTNIIVTAKYDLLLVDEPRDEQGRIEYYICACKKVVSRGDTTLDNITITETI